MASVFKRENSPCWYAAYRGADNRRIKVSTKLTDRKKALAFANTLEKAATDSRAGLLTESVARKLIAQSYEIGANRSMNFSSAKDWLLNWFDEKKQTKRDGTYIRYKSATLAFIQSLGKRSDLDIKHIDVRDAQKFRKDLIANGKRNKSINMDCKAVSTAFNHADRMGMIDRNPFVGLDKLDEDLSVKKPFTHKQVEKILSLCEGEWKGLCLVAYYTGMRISDITSLKWGNLKLDDEVPHLKFTEIKKQNKHKREIIIPLSKLLLEYFVSLKNGKAKEFIFSDLSKHSTGGNKGLSQSFKRILKKAGIVKTLYEKQKKGSAARNVSPYGFHSFRHTFKTELANCGVNSDIRDVLSGHAKSSVAEAYVHRDISLLKDAVDKLKVV
jgi:integrase